MVKKIFQRQSKLDRQIDAVLNSMDEFGPEVSEYEQLLSNLERLKKMRAEEATWVPTGDAMVTAAASILGILTIVKFEQFNVLTSKAMALLLRSKHTN